MKWFSIGICEDLKDKVCNGNRITFTSIKKGSVNTLVCLTGEKQYGVTKVYPETFSFRIITLKIQIIGGY